MEIWTMLDKNAKQDILKKILSSADFEHSEKHQKLLTYLFNASIKGEIPHEHSIAFDVFNKDGKFNTNEDTTVRVNVYHLRKKLAKYYQNEGKHDKIRVKIPTGHYSLKFIRYAKTRRFSKTHVLQIIAGLAVLIIILLAVSSLYLYNQNRILINQVKPFPQKLDHYPIWSNFLDSSFPTLIALAEIFHFKKYDPVLDTWVLSRLGSVENETDLQQLEEQYPSLQFDLCPAGAPGRFTMNSIGPLVYVQPLFTQSGKNFRLQRSQAITPGDLKKNNIIYLGYYQSLGVFKDVTQKLSFYFDMDQKLAIAKMGSGDSTLIFKHAGSFKEHHNDYSIVYHLPGPNANSVLIISSFTSTGTMGVAKYLTNPAQLLELKTMFIEKYNHMPDYFELVFQVSGYYRTDFNAQIKAYRRIDPDIDLW
ncbi:MAG: hypothetical protein U5R06_05325 [candidate division KSB1 bacterium]|nr:hypothetical protein [candidate division KSB1 bacterium]